MTSSLQTVTASFPVFVNRPSISRDDHIKSNKHLGLEFTKALNLLYIVTALVCAAIILVVLSSCKVYAQSMGQLPDDDNQLKTSYI